MSKRQYNDIEAMMKQLADAQDEAFEEAAWDKMEKLLNKENEKRRPLFYVWWLLPILLAGGLVFYFGIKNKPNTAELTVNSIQPAFNSRSSYDQGIREHVTDTLTTATVGTSNVRHETGNTKSLLPGFAGSKQKPGLDNNLADDEKKFIREKRTTTAKVDNQKNGAWQAASPGRLVFNPGIPVTNEQHTLASKTEAAGAPTDSHTKTAITIPAEPLKKIPNANKPDSGAAKITGSRPASKGFYLLLGAGVETNGLRLLPSANATTRIGVGLGYKINSRLSVQSGFYSSSKKYLAGTADYKPKAGSYWSTVDIKSIEANCRVYEIPITARYDFKSRKKTVFFTTIGLSSILMNREDYHYYYEHYGISYNAEAKYEGNKHLFSLLRLAAGVEKEFSSKWSVQLSPSFSVPLSGVGEGSVKLFSTDLMLGVKYSPGLGRNR